MCLGHDHSSQGTDSHKVMGQVNVAGLIFSSCICRMSTNFNTFVFTLFEHLHSRTSLTFGLQ